uniref:Malectin-like domain-containing protein n=1 Tax=Kalanchoe fedtschenkoi TaxID=63787 RepID=A0A7N0VHP7_KALFE
ILSLPPPPGVLINCGSTKPIEVGPVRYIPDEGLIATGNTTALKTPNLLPLLSTLRYFPDEKARKYCYVLQSVKGGRYLIRTSYWYGGFDGGKTPPVFDQIIGGTKWGTVNTTEDFAKGLSSYYELVVAATGKTMSVCLARNAETLGSPFISGIEMISLGDSLYNTTDFTRFALASVARHSFGHEDDEIVSYPDDPFNRYWQPFKDENPIVQSKSAVSSFDFWNLPPATVFGHALTTSRGKSLTVKWPAFSLPSGDYFISLYFQDPRTSSPYSWRNFDVKVNGQNFYTNLNATAAGVTVYSANWPLAGSTEILMTPAKDSPVGPVINAGEIYQLIPLSGRTQTRDVIAMEDLARSFSNPPPDWKGDACLPLSHGWTGVTCDTQKKLARVTKIDLTGMGISGSLPERLVNLTALTHLWLGGNKLTGNIPELSQMPSLQTLHLESNNLEGPIPNSLGDLLNLQELSLQNNNLTGDIPKSLKNKSNLTIQVSPGNSLLHKG